MPAASGAGNHAHKPGCVPAADATPCTHVGQQAQRADQGQQQGLQARRPAQQLVQCQPTQQLVQLRRQR